jgi:hypothetical protein
MKKVLGCIIIIMALFTNCSNNDEKLNNESIIYQKGKIKIIFLEINEGRCPTNVDCIWQGNAEKQGTSHLPISLSQKTLISF